MIHLISGPLLNHSGDLFTILSSRNEISFEFYDQWLRHLLKWIYRERCIVLYNVSSQKRPHHLLTYSSYFFPFRVDFEKVDPLFLMSTVLPIARDWALTGNTRVNLGALTIWPKIPTNGTKISWESSRKSGNCWISEKRTIQLKISEITGWKSNGKGISRKTFFENLGIPHEVVLYFGIYANSQFPTQRYLVLLAAITVS